VPKQVIAVCFGIQFKDHAVATFQTRVSADGFDIIHPRRSNIAPGTGCDREPDDIAEPIPNLNWPTRVAPDGEKTDLKKRAQSNG
jgi:hypothetical protein